MNSSLQIFISQVNSKGISYEIKKPLIFLKYKRLPDSKRNKFCALKSHHQIKI